MCPVCKKEIDKRLNIEAILEEGYGYLLKQVDYFGQESLTEGEQMLYNNLVHVACYEDLE